MRTESGILDQLYKLTKAVPVKPTAEEARQIKEMNEELYKSRQDQIQMEEVIRKIKREKAVLAAARGEVLAAKEH
jgi:large subunit ribosomal protein MRP49